MKKDLAEYRRAQVITVVQNPDQHTWNATANGGVNIGIYSATVGGGYSITSSGNQISYQTPACQKDYYGACTHLPPSEAYRNM